MNTPPIHAGTVLEVVFRGGRLILDGGDSTAEGLAASGWSERWGRNADLEVFSTTLLVNPKLWAQGP